MRQKTSLIAILLAATIACTDGNLTANNQDKILFRNGVELSCKEVVNAAESNLTVFDYQWSPENLRSHVMDLSKKPAPDNFIYLEEAVRAYAKCK